MTSLLKGFGKTQSCRKCKHQRQVLQASRCQNDILTADLRAGRERVVVHCELRTIKCARCLVAQAAWRLEAECGTARQGL